MLLCRCLVCPAPSCLSVTLAYCGQTAGWIKMPLGTEIGLDPGPVVLHVTAPQPKKGAHPQCSAHVCCGQTVAHLSSYCWAFLIRGCWLSVAGAMLTPAKYSLTSPRTSYTAITSRVYELCVGGILTTDHVLGRGYDIRYKQTTRPFSNFSR